MEYRDATFLGLPAAPDLSAPEADVVVLGVPIGVRYPHQVADSSDAPATIRAASQRFARFLHHHDFDIGGPLLPAGVRVVDAGDAPGDGTDETAVARATGEAVRQILAGGAVPIVLGGDDSVPIPVLRAYEAHGPITVVQIDAHLDFRDEVSGIRDGYSSAMRRASEMPWVERIFQVGLRGVGSARETDVEDALAAGNVLIPAREVHRLGVEVVFDRLPEEAALFVSLDLDALDPSVAPAVNAPLPGGLTFDECADLLRGLATRARLAGAVITELSPAIDVNGLSALVAVRLAWTLIGAVARARVEQ